MPAGLVVISSRQRTACERDKLGNLDLMGTQRKSDFVDHALSDEAVRGYLEANPDFFEDHADLLGSLRLPHTAGGAVSLVERQVSMLRQKDLKLERRLKDLLEVARANDALAAKIHRLTLHLFGAGSLAETLEVCETTLRTTFDADQSVLVLFGDPAHFEDVGAGRFCRPMRRDDPALQAFDTFLAGNSPRCGQIRDAQRDCLFGPGTDEIGSCALVPLGTNSDAGFLAIGSADADRFHPGMSIDFLARLGDLVAAALRRF